VIAPLTLAGALIVCNDLRPLDAACVRAVAGQEPGEWFAVDRWQTHGVALEVRQDGMPWAVFGLSLPTSWAGLIWMVARPGMRLESWKKGIREMRRLLAQVSDPSHPEYRHRIEAHVLEGWTEAAQFVERLGFRHEHTRERAGMSGESVQVWVRLGPVRGH
jgi:hypothetical protein